MPKRKRTSESRVEAVPVLQPVEMRRGGFIPIICPSGDRRHTTGIRLGKISAEVFCRNPKRRAELGLPPLVSLLD